jgi:hypothetical protein
VIPKLLGKIGSIPLKGKWVISDTTVWRIIRIKTTTCARGNAKEKPV